MRGRLWSKSDDAALRGAIEACRPIEAIAADLGRTPASVQTRMSKTGIRIRPWSRKSDPKSVASLHAVGAPIKIIARRLDVRPAQVVWAIRAHGLVNARSRSIIGSLPFDDEILRLRGIGMRVAEIARRVGEPERRVRGRLVTLERRRLIADVQVDAATSFSLSSPQQKIGDNNNGVTQ